MKNIIFTLFIFIFIFFFFFFFCINLAKAQEDKVYLTINFPENYSKILKYNGYSANYSKTIRLLISDMDKRDENSSRTKYILLEGKNKRSINIEGRGSVKFNVISDNFIEKLALIKRFREGEFVNIILPKGRYIFSFQFENIEGGWFIPLPSQVDGTIPSNLNKWIHLNPSLID